VTIVKDLLQGEVTVQNYQLDDMVMLRNDGSPTYMLAVVVDDHDMGITHIIRGDDHLTNAFRQKQIYQAMGWSIPEFAHIPLIHDKNGKKLSKREGALGIDAYEDVGYLPEAVINHLLRLGWAHGNDEIISLSEAVELFTLDGVGKAPAKFDMDKLNFINATYLRKYNNETLLKMLKKILHDLSPIVEKRILSGMDGLKNRAHTLLELAEGSKIYIDKFKELDQKSIEILEKFGTTLLPSLKTYCAQLEDWSKDALHNEFEKFANQNQVKLPVIMQLLRASVLGTFAAPGIFEVMSILGKEETLNRLS